MKSSLLAGIAEAKADSVELTITVSPEYISLAAKEPFLREMVAYAVGLGYSRCIGAIRNQTGEGVKTFFSSKPEYFDKDDMLVADSELKYKRDLLIKESL